MTRFRDDIKVRSALEITRRGPDGETRRRRGPKGAPPIRLESNVSISLKDRKGRIAQKRQGHNIFLNYGRDWLAHLVALDTGDTTFRDDRIKYIACGIGGVNQKWSSDSIRALHAGMGSGSWPGFPNEWIAGAGGVGDPSQTDSDPTSLALEWPVQKSAGIYYDNISQPALFPGTTGIVRFTIVAGYNEISFGAYDSVPVSEIGLFTQSVSDLSVAPTEAIPPSEKFMVAYHTFDSLSKTSEFVMQVDWELRFS